MLRRRSGFLNCSMSQDNHLFNPTTFFGRLLFFFSFIDCGEEFDGTRENETFTEWEKIHQSLDLISMKEERQRSNIVANPCELIS